MAPSRTTSEGRGGGSVLSFLRQRRSSGTRRGRILVVARSDGTERGFLPSVETKLISWSERRETRDAAFGPRPSPPPRARARSTRGERVGARRDVARLQRRPSANKTKRGSLLAAHAAVARRRSPRRWRRVRTGLAARSYAPPARAPRAPRARARAFALARLLSHLGRGAALGRARGRDSRLQRLPKVEVGGGAVVRLDKLRHERGLLARVVRRRRAVERRREQRRRESGALLAAALHLGQLDAELLHERLALRVRGGAERSRGGPHLGRGGGSEVARKADGRGTVGDCGRGISRKRCAGRWPSERSRDTRTARGAV